MNEDERREIKARHQRVLNFCGFDSQAWPCDAARLLEVAEEAVNFTTVWQSVLPYAPDDYGFTMQCTEAEAAAALFRVVGDDDTADAVLDAHAVSDTDEDDEDDVYGHHARGAEVRARRQMGWTMPAGERQ